jgi:hypothetical protein
MYRLLVESGTITGDEFWECFRTDLSEKARSNSSAELKFGMSKETMAQILAKHPDVQEQYRVWVGEHSQEKGEEFWKMYLRRVEAKGNDDREMFDRLARHRRDAIEMPRSMEDEVPEAFRETISLLNMGSELALAQAGEEREEEAPVVEEREEDVFIPRRRAAAAENPELAEAAVRFLQEVQMYSYDFTKLPEVQAIPADEANEVLSEMSETSETTFNLEKLKTDDKAIVTCLARLRKHKMEQQILLFHFWNYVDKEDDDSRQKATRLSEKLRELEKICWSEVRAIPSPTVGRLIAPLYTELNDAFSKIPISE